MATDALAADCAGWVARLRGSPCALRLATTAGALLAQALDCLRVEPWHLPKPRCVRTVTSERVDGLRMCKAGAAKLFFKTFDAGWTKPPVVVVHGGPGGSHHHLLRLVHLAKQGRSVVFYDQLGCGGSDDPDDPEGELYGITQSAGELASVIEHVCTKHGVEKVHVIGQSWGGVLAYECILRGAANSRVASLTLSNAPSSVKKMWEACDRYREVVERRYGVSCAPWDTTPEQSDVFGAAHYCRVFPKPRHLAHGGLPKKKNNFVGSDKVADFAVRDRGVAERAFPSSLRTLLVSGEFDIVAPEVVEPWLDALPEGRATWHLIQGASHGPYEESKRCRDEFFRVVRDFLEAAEAELPASRRPSAR